MAKTTNTTTQAINAVADALTTAECISGGIVIKATADGKDPENASISNLLPNGLYIKLNFTNGKTIYISAFEIDKAISIIGDIAAGKANESDLELLESELASKASNNKVDLITASINNKADKTEVTALTETVDTKADKTEVTALTETVDTKADKTEVTALTETVESKADKTEVTALTETVESKADIETVETLKADIETLEAAMESISDNAAITALKKQIEYLHTELQKRLTIDDIADLEESIENNNAAVEGYDEKIENVEKQLQGKADTTYVQSQVLEVIGAINAMSTRVDNKIDPSELTAVTDPIKNDLELTISTLTNLKLTSEQDFETLKACCEVVKAELLNTATKDYVDSLISNAVDNIDSKADQVFVNKKVQELATKINTIDENTSNFATNISSTLHEIECEFDSSIYDVNNSITGINKQINQHSDKISKLEANSSDYNNLLKQSWVRVLSSREYKSLRPAPEGVPYNSRYIYPNTVYLVVDFNKPKALYIGSVMIAQAEQQGSIGFAYTFPIVFN